MIAPPKPSSSDNLEALVKEARARQLRRRVVGVTLVAIAAGAGLAVWAVVSGGNQPTVRQHGGQAGNGTLPQDTPSCGVRVAGAHIVSRSGRVLYREPGTSTHPVGRVRCSGATIWAVFENGAASNQEAYVGARSGDHGRTWRLVFTERFFGLKAPHELDPYLGPFAVVGPRVAYFTGWCPACSPKPTVSLWVTKNLGRTFRRYSIASLAGYAPTRMRVAKGRVTIQGTRMMYGGAPRKTVTVRVG